MKLVQGAAPPRSECFFANLLPAVNGHLASRLGNEPLELTVNPQDERMFLLGDAASCAKSGQKVPEGFYNIQLMLNRVTRSGGKVGVCGTCMEARGIAETELAEGTQKSTLAELTAWTQWADKVLVF